DHLESTIALADATGSVVEREQYDVYGGNRGSNLTRYLYTGRELDSATGLIYYRGRYYNANIGRFISEDPFGLGGGSNFYEYATGDPLESGDPLGLCPPKSKECEQKIEQTLNDALNTTVIPLGPTQGPGVRPDGYRNGAYNFNFFAPGVSNPLAGSVNNSGRFPGSGLHIPPPGGQDPTIPNWGPGVYNGQEGSYITAHIDSANPLEDLVGLFKHLIGDVLLKRPHGC